MSYFRQIEEEGEKRIGWGLTEGDSCFQKLMTHNTGI